MKEPFDVSVTIYNKQTNRKQIYNMRRVVVVERKKLLVEKYKKKTNNKRIVGDRKEDSRTINRYMYIFIEQLR